MHEAVGHGTRKMPRGWMHDDSRRLVYCNQAFILENYIEVHVLWYDILVLLVEFNQGLEDIACGHPCIYMDRG